ncbi:MAG: hypothetical protein RMZ41_015345 [Nostoc sp. DedVER02]
MPFFTVVENNFRNMRNFNPRKLLLRSVEIIAIARAKNFADLFIHTVM